MTNTRTERQLLLYAHVLGDRLGLDVATPEDGQDCLHVSTREGLHITVLLTAELLPEYLCFGVEFALPDLSPERRQGIAQAVTSDIQVAKGSATADGIQLTIEAITSAPDTLPSAEHLTATLPRLLDCLHAAARHMGEEIALADILDADPN